MTAEPLWSVAGITDAVEARSVSASTVAEIALERIARSQPVHNCFITIDAAGARQQAAQLDRRVARGERVGPLVGVPVAVKDVFDVAGLPTTAGSSLLADNIAPDDGAAAQALRRAGAIIVGKTNMDEFAFGPNQFAFGRTNCPADPTRYAGGSSAGSAAAVAAGCVPIALGSDAGGSVRYPAACCGVVGYKPSFDRYGIQGSIPSLPSLDHLGVLAGCVDDVVRLDAVLLNQDVRYELIEAAPVVGVPAGWRELSSDEVHAGIDATLSMLATRGATIVDVEPLDEVAVFDALLTIACAEAAASLDNLLNEAQQREIAPAIQQLIARGRAEPATAYAAAQRFRDELRNQIDAQLSTVDVLLTPTVASVAKRWDAPDLTDWSIARFLPAFNLSGHPAISLPVPVKGLPVGIQIVTRRGADTALFATTSWIEGQLATERQHGAM